VSALWIGLSVIGAFLVGAVAGWFLGYPAGMEDQKAIDYHRGD
jgi:hypothetical protein